jgi:hypothetical protein
VALPFTSGYARFLSAKELAEFEYPPFELAGIAGTLDMLTSPVDVAVLAAEAQKPGSMGYQNSPGATVGAGLVSQS